MPYSEKYDTPADVLRDDTLSRAAKIRKLEQWRDDKKAYMRATDEGMEGPDRAELLREVKKALILLQDGPAA